MAVAHAINIKNFTLKSLVENRGLQLIPLICPPPVLGRPNYVSITEHSLKEMSSIELSRMIRPLKTRAKRTYKAKNISNTINAAASSTGGRTSNKRFTKKSSKVSISEDEDEDYSDGEYCPSPSPPPRKRKPNPRPKANRHNRYVSNVSELDFTFSLFEAEEFLEFTPTENKTTFEQYEANTPTTPNGYSTTPTSVVEYTSKDFSSCSTSRSSLPSSSSSSMPYSNASMPYSTSSSTQLMTSAMTSSGITIKREGYWTLDNSSYNSVDLNDVELFRRDEIMDELGFASS